MYADARLKAEVLSEVIEKKWWSHLGARKRQNALSSSLVYRSDKPVDNLRSHKLVIDINLSWAMTMRLLLIGFWDWRLRIDDGDLGCAFLFTQRAKAYVQSQACLPNLSWVRATSAHQSLYTLSRRLHTCRNSIVCALGTHIVEDKKLKIFAPTKLVLKLLNLN